MSQRGWGALSSAKAVSGGRGNRLKLTSRGGVQGSGDDVPKVDNILRKIDSYRKRDDKLVHKRTVLKVKEILQAVFQNGDGRSLGATRSQLVQSLKKPRFPSPLADELLLCLAVALLHASNEVHGLAENGDLWGSLVIL